MRILVVAATGPEVAPLIAQMGPPSQPRPGVKTYTRHHHAIDILTTGVGMVATAARCSRVLATESYDVALNIGVCGSFDPKLELGRVVHVVADRIAELGAEDGERFLTVQDLKLLGENEFPFIQGQLINPAPPAISVLSALPAVSGITVNTVHGNEASIDGVERRFNPQIESMEGAAFMYACLIHDLAFAQVRAVSNIVERRNRAAWKIAEAIQSLSETALRILDNV